MKIKILLSNIFSLHLKPVYPKRMACRNPPIPVRKFTAPDPSEFSAQIWGRWRKRNWQKLGEKDLCNETTVKRQTFQKPNLEGLSDVSETLGQLLFCSFSLLQFQPANSKHTLEGKKNQSHEIMYHDIANTPLGQVHLIMKPRQDIQWFTLNSFPFLHPLYPGHGRTLRVRHRLIHLQVIPSDFRFHGIHDRESNQDNISLFHLLTWG